MSESMLSASEPKQTTAQESQDLAVTSDSLTETLYINNLNEKVSLTKLKKNLNDIFSKYGEVIQLTAHRNLRMKGQAFISFKDVNSSRQALEKLQNFKLFDKELRIAYAKTNSDSAWEQELSGEEFQKYLNGRKEQKVKREEELAVLKAKKAERESLKRKNQNIVSESFNAPKKQKVVESSNPVAANFENLPPNKVLLLQNLPKSVNSEKLNELFASKSGFVEVRLVSIRNLAFVEFENENYSGDVLKELKGKLVIDGVEPLFTFAKA